MACFHQLYHIYLSQSLPVALNETLSPDTGYAPPLLPDPLLQDEGSHSYADMDPHVQQQALAAGPCHSSVPPRQNGLGLAPEQTSVHSDSDEWVHDGIADGASHLEVPQQGTKDTS